MLADHRTFFTQFRERFESTGAVAPSSRFLARAMTAPLSRHRGPVRILEVGPGTGAVTRRIVKLLGPEARLDLVELNPEFVSLLERKFERDADYQSAAERARIHRCPIQEFQAEEPYDYIISGLPLNNFPPDLVRSIFDVFFRLLAPQGVLSYFEYMYVRPLRRLVSGADERRRLNELESVIAPYFAQHRIRRDWVFVNLPPAWVQHLRATPPREA
jgi:phospholipid N-methyltransferase